MDDILSEINKVNVGCRLGIAKVNIQAYADDMALLSPAASGLQKLMSRMSDMLECHQLLVNANKTKIVVFNRQSRDFAFRFKNTVLDLVDNIKYLGCVLNFKLCDDLDIDRCNVSFNRSFVFLSRKFNSVSIDVFYSLFHSYCLSFYGIELWIKMKSAGNFKAMSISYHATIKRMLGLPKRFSNHFACNFLGILTFEHFLSNMYFRYLSWLFNCNSPCFNPFKLYFIRHSSYAQYIYDRFLTKYDISDLLRQDKDADLARLLFSIGNLPLFMELMNDKMENICNFTF